MMSYQFLLLSVCINSCRRLNRVVANKAPLTSLSGLFLLQLIRRGENHGKGSRVKGVLKTEIDPLQPKVTVLGSVDPKILIKRLLLKAGKQAEFWSSGNQNQNAVKNEIEKSKPECEQAKPEDPCVNKTTDKIKESNNGNGNGREGGGEEKASKNNEKAKENENPVNSYIPEVTKTENTTHTIPPNPEVTKTENTTHTIPPNPAPEMSFGMYPNMVHEVGNVRTQAQYCYMVEPCPITIPYHAIPPPYPAHPLPHPTCCGGGQGYFCHDRTVYQPQFQAPSTLVGDYFSDENTVGCSVM